ncbi:hypothetical protein RSW84_27180, partial [Escherichia coli]
MHIVYETLKGLDVTDKPVITAFNKQDRLTQSVVLRDFKADHIVNISAKTGEGLEKMQEILENVLREKKMAV